MTVQTDRSVESTVLREWSYRSDASTTPESKRASHLVQDQGSSSPNTNTNTGILPVSSFVSSVSNIAGQLKSQHDTLVQHAYDIGNRLSSRGSAASAAGSANSTPVCSPSRPVLHSRERSVRSTGSLNTPLRVTGSVNGGGTSRPTSSPPLNSLHPVSEWHDDWNHHHLDAHEQQLQRRQQLQHQNNNNNNLDIDVLGNGRFVEVFSETDSTSSIADSAFSSSYSHNHHYPNNNQYYEDDQAGGTACFQHPNNVQEVTTRVGKWWKRRKENREVRREVTRERLSSRELRQANSTGGGRRNRFKGKKGRKIQVTNSNSGEHRSNNGFTTRPCPSKHSQGGSSRRRQRNDTNNNTPPVQQHMDRTAPHHHHQAAQSNFSSSAIELMNHMKELSTSIHSKYSAGTTEEKRNPQEQSRYTTDGISEQYNGLENFFVQTTTEEMTTTNKQRDWQNDEFVNVALSFNPQMNSNPPSSPSPPPPEDIGFDVAVARPNTSLSGYPASDITFDGGFETLDKRNTSLETELPDSCKKPNRIGITFPETETALRTFPSKDEGDLSADSVKYKVHQIESRIDASSSNEMNDLQPQFLFSSMTQPASGGSNDNLKSVTSAVSIGSTTTSARLRSIPIEEHYNDTLKIVLVGAPGTGKTSLINGLTESSSSPTSSKGDGSSSRRGISSRAGGGGSSSRRGGLRRKDSSVKSVKNKIDVHIKSWKPSVSFSTNNNQGVQGVEQNGKSVAIDYNLWDLQGGTIDSGSHHATQSLFFSENSLYIIAWDMSANNPLALRPGTTKVSSMNNKPSQDEQDVRDSYSSDEYDDQYNDDDDISVEMANKRADRELERDIDEKVLYWVDYISKHVSSSSSSGNGGNYAILPVVTFQDIFDKEEVRRRCSVLKNKLSSLQSSINILYNESNELTTASCMSDGGMEQLQHSILYNTVSSNKKFHGHIGLKLSPIMHSIQSIITSFKEQDFKVLHLDDIFIKLAENPPQVESFSIRKNLVVDALRFLSSTGSIMYFGGGPKLLSDFIILDPSWIGNVISCILQKDIRRELMEMNGDYISRSKSFISSHHNCPILSEEETLYIWKNMDFIGQAVDKLKVLHSSESEDLYSFFIQICEYHGIFLPFGADEIDQTYYFTPSLSNDVPEDIWSFKSKDINWKATLCQTWVIHNRVPSGLIDKVIANILKSFSRNGKQFTAPKIHQMICWKTAFYAKVERNRSVVEFFVRLIRSASPYCVASSPGVFGNWKIIVSAKGVIGLDGEAIWNSGYKQILGLVDETMKASECRYTREVVCPDCLATSNPRDVIAWPMHDHDTGDSYVPTVCDHGHHVNSRLLFGEGGDDDTVTSGSTSMSTSTYSSYTTASTLTTPRHGINDIVQSVVLVGLWNTKSNRIERVGSGFIADRKRGLIITASHIFFKMEIDQEVESYWHHPHTKAVIGMISPGSDEAAFTYCADIIYEDVCNVDACVLRVKARFEEPIHLDSTTLGIQSEIPVSNRTRRNVLAEPRLHFNDIVQLEDQVRVIGFNQRGEGVLREGEHLNRTVDLTNGYVARNLKKTTGKHITLREFVPSSEIIVMCYTIRGHSGGPCVNQDGQVIGLVSRADPDEFKRCYLVPSSELKRLLKEAKKKCDARTENRFSI